MRWWMALVIAGMVSVGCAETVRCPDGEIFDDDAECTPVPDAGSDAGSEDDAATPVDGGA